MNTKSNSLGKFLEFADSYLNFERTPKKNIFWLETMKFLCSRLNDPQLYCPSVHVAGSKGKGSVSIMVASIFRESGLKTGLFSSPHIVDFEERITECGKYFPESVYEKSVEELISLLKSIPESEYPGERPVTWFELVTVLSMLCYRNSGCKASVYETGLGGRLDSTNVVSPKVTAITQIELEHTEFLGDTIEKIAMEKAGIIKNGVPVVVGVQVYDEAKAVFEKVAREKGSEIFFVQDDVRTVSKKIEFNEDGSFRANSFVASSRFFKRDISVSLSMPGDFQIENALCAALCAKCFDSSIDEETIEKGLSKAHLDGRFEIADFQRDGVRIPVVFDGAHTVNSISFTMDTLRKVFGKKTFNLLFACAFDKNVEEISSLFKNEFSSVTLTVPGSDKKPDTKRLLNAFNASSISFDFFEDYRKACLIALDKALKSGEGLLVTGSFYLVSEAKTFITRISGS